MSQLPIDFHAAVGYRGVKHVLVCGSRSLRRDQWELIRAEIACLPAGCTVVHGGCRGVDELAGWFAAQRGLAVAVHPKMLESGVDYVIAFWDGSSKGTLDTLTKARKMGIPIRVIGI